MIESEVAYLISQRTLTQAEVDERARSRAALDPLPEQRLESHSAHAEGEPSRH